MYTRIGKRFIKVPYSSLLSSKETFAKEILYKNVFIIIIKNFKGYI